MTQLAIGELTVRFGGLTALNRVSITFDPHEVTGIIGPNGSGKSTLINAVTGEVRPHSGSVRLDSALVTGKAAHRLARRGLARTFQVPRIPHDVSLEDVLSVPMTFLSRRRRHPALKDIPAILKLCGIERDPAGLCGEMSTPELRRLEIARALACSPEVLFLDEVMASLPATEADEAIKVIRSIHALGICVIIVEHVLPIITGVCDRVVVLDHGALLASGTPARVLADIAVQDAYLGNRGAS